MAFPEGTPAETANNGTNYRRQRLEGMRNYYRAAARSSRSRKWNMTGSGRGSLRQARSMSFRVAGPERQVEVNEEKSRTVANGDVHRSGLGACHIANVAACAPQRRQWPKSGTGSVTTISAVGRDRLETASPECGRV